MVTCDDIRRFIKEAGATPKGARKDDLIQQAKAIYPGVPIFDEIRESVAAGKIVIAREDWERVAGAAEVLRCEPTVKGILASGRAEVALRATDPDTAVPLKGKLDWLDIKGSRATIADLKTFSNSRGKSVDQAIADSIFYEGYYRQAYLYTRLLELQPNPPAHIEFVFIFVESEPPYETASRRCGQRPAPSPTCTGFAG